MKSRLDLTIPVVSGGDDFWLPFDWMDDVPDTTHDAVIDAAVQRIGEADGIRRRAIKRGQR